MDVYFGEISELLSTDAAIVALFIVISLAKLQILFELWRALTENVADTAEIISISRFAGMHQEVADKILQLIRDWQEVTKQ